MNRRSFLRRTFGTVAALATGAVGFEKLVTEAIPADVFAGIDRAMRPIQPTEDGYYTLFVSPECAKDLANIEEFKRTCVESGHLGRYYGFDIRTTEYVPPA